MTHESQTQDNKHFRLSVVMIVKNEADNLRLSLPSVQDFADEIIIVDSGSEDDGEQIAAQFGVKWFKHEHWQGFGKQRQLAQRYATGDWILALDADEVVTPNLKKAILQVISQAPQNTIYGIKRLDFVFGEQIDSSFWGVKAHWRLYPANFQYNDNLVHESVNIEQAQTKILDGYLHHHTASDPQFWLSKRLEYAFSWAKQRHQNAKKVTIFGVFARAFWAFIKQYFIDGRFIQGAYGFIYAGLFSEYTFNKYAILYDMNRQPESYLSNFQPHAITYRQLPPLSAKKTKGVATISAVLIVKNEQKHLPACLANIEDIVDEIVILDSGSTDATRDIATHFNAKFYVNTNWQGFGKQRQIAQSYATSDYILMLDADEQLDEQLKQEIKAFTEKPVITDHAFAVARVNIFCHQRIHPKGWYADNIARFYARDHFSYSDLDVHESLEVNIKKTPTLEGYMLHYTNDNLYHFLFKNVRYSQDWAVEKNLANKQIRLLSTPFRALFAFLREYIIRAAFMGGSYGAILSVAAASYNFNKYIMLWVFQQQKKTKNPREKRNAI